MAMRDPLFNKLARPVPARSNLVPSSLKEIVIVYKTHFDIG